MDFLKKLVHLTAVMFLIGFILGLEHNDSWLHWLGSFVIIVGFFVAIFWKEVSNPRWRRRQWSRLMNQGLP